MFESDWWNWIKNYWSKIYDLILRIKRVLFTNSQYKTKKARIEVNAIKIDQDLQKYEIIILQEK